MTSASSAGCIAVQSRVRPQDHAVGHDLQLLADFRCPCPPPPVVAPDFTVSFHKVINSRRDLAMKLGLGDQVADITIPSRLRIIC